MHVKHGVRPTSKHNLCYHAWNELHETNFRAQLQLSCLLEHSRRGLQRVIQGYHEAYHAHDNPRNAPNLML